MTPQEIETKYQEFCKTPSDINTHLPTLREYYDKCESVTEFGVRGCVSLFAALASKAEKVVAYDIFDVWTPDVPKLTFHCADVLQVEIEETDALLIDTRHDYEQIKQELAIHSPKVRKWIFMHDTISFGDNGETTGSVGIMPAIKEFLDTNPQWIIRLHNEFNNGMMLLERN